MCTASSSPRHILHADLDAFFSSVEQMDDASLRGSPVLVGGKPEHHGVVAACSYEARAYGIHSAMSMRRALNLCPAAVVISPRFDRYHEISKQVMDVFKTITRLVQPLSIDEAYLDITELVVSGIAPVDVGRILKTRVRQQVGLVISVGIGTSKSVSKIASDSSKPNGLIVVEPGTERAFLAPMPVRKLPGIGPITEQKLAKVRIYTLGDLSHQSEEWLHSNLGKRGRDLGSMSRGEDRGLLTTQSIVKSISVEETFSQDETGWHELSEKIAEFSLRIARELKISRTEARTITLKLRLADFTTFTRSLTRPVPTSNCSVIREVGQRLLCRELVAGRRFRLLGIGVSNFAVHSQLELFNYESLQELR